MRTESEAEWAWLGTQFREANSAPPIKRAIGVQRPLLADAYAVAGGNDEKAARILRVSPGHGIWMPPQPLGVARKPRSVLQTAIRLGGYLGTGRSRTARRGLLGEICPASRSKPEGGKEQA